MAGKNGGSRRSSGRGIALKALRKRDSVRATAARYGIHPTQVRRSKRQLMEGHP